MAGIRTQGPVRTRRRVTSQPRRSQRIARSVEPEATIRSQPAGDPVFAGGTVMDLSQQLGVLERDLRHAWVSLLGLNTEAAGRIGDAGRLIHRAKALLDDTTLIR